MEKPNSEESVRNLKADVTRKEEKSELRELFLIDRCPTPGCKCGQVRVESKDGKIVGFSCSYGCHYKAKRNELTGKIDYFELTTFDYYHVDTVERGYRVTRSGYPYIAWH